MFPITDHDLYINGVDQGTLESLAGATWTPGLGQNGYLVITATGGSSITSVGFQDDNTAVKAARLSFVAGWSGTAVWAGCGATCAAN